MIELKLKNMISHLRVRSQMYLFDSSYSSLSSFLIGFGIGSATDEKNIFEDFNEWLQKKAGNDFSLHWSAYVLNEICKYDESKANEVLLDLLEEFLNVHASPPCQ